MHSAKFHLTTFHKMLDDKAITIFKKFNFSPHLFRL